MEDKSDSIGLYLDLMKKTLTASIYAESAWQIENKGVVGNYLKQWFARKYLDHKSLLLVNTRDYDRTQRMEGRDWPMFGYTMAGHHRLDNVQMCVEDVLKNQIPGDFIETGVWRGGTTIFMRALLKAYGVTDRKVWVADSFDGLPAPENKTDGPDLSQVDALKVSLEDVKSNFSEFELLDDQVEFLEGWFCDTLPGAPIDKLSILRLDGDMYNSTMDALTSLFDKVSKGGYVIVDDYYSWDSCKAAVTDFLKERSLGPEIREIDWTGAYWQV